MKKEEKKEPKIIDNSKANRALKKLRNLKSKKQEKEEFAEKEKAIIDEWLQSEVKGIDNDIEYFEGILTEYANSLKAKDKDLKTHNLPFGKLKFRKQQPKFKYEDDKLLDSVKAAGLMDLISVKESVNKNDLKKAKNLEIVGEKMINKDTGEIIEGVTVKQRAEKFSIEV